MFNRTLVDESAGGDAGQHVHSERRLRSQFGGDVFDGTEEVAVRNRIGHFPTVRALAVHPRLALGVVFGSARPTQHLANFHHGERPTHAVVPSFEVPNEHASGREVHACGEGRCGGQCHQKPVFEGLLDVFSLTVGEPCVMKTNARCEARSQLFGEVGLTPPRQPLGQRFQGHQTFRVLFFEPFTNALGEVFRFRLCASTSAHEHQDLRLLREAVVNNAPNRVALETLKVPRRA